MRPFFVVEPDLPLVATLSSFQPRFELQHSPLTLLNSHLLVVVVGGGVDRSGLSCGGEEETAVEIAVAGVFAAHSAPAGLCAGECAVVCGDPCAGERTLCW